MVTLRRLLDKVNLVLVKQKAKSKLSSWQSWNLTLVDDLASSLHSILGERKLMGLLSQVSYGIPMLDCAPGEICERGDQQPFSALDAVYVLLGTLSSAHGTAVLQSQ